MEVVEKEFQNYIKENLELFIDIDLNSVEIDDSRIKYMIKKYVKSLKIRQKNDKILDKIIKLLSDHSYEGYQKFDEIVSKLNGIIDIYNEENKAFETYDRKADYSIKVEIENQCDFYFSVSLFEEYIKLIKYYSKIPKNIDENKYQLCKNYFYENVMRSVPFYTFVAFIMIMKYYPEKENEVEEYIKNVILTYDYPNARYVK